MNGSATFVLFRLLHILSGALWVGGAIVIAAFIMPSIQAIGPAGGPMMAQLGKVRRFPIYMMTASVLTLLSGLLIYWMDGQSFGTSWMASTPGRVFGLGGLLAIIAGVLGMTMMSPAGKRMGEISAAIQSGGKPPTPEQISEMQRLQARVQKVGPVVLTLILLATTCMAVARYTG